MEMTEVKDVEEGEVEENKDEMVGVTEVVEGTVAEVEVVAEVAAEIATVVAVEGVIMVAEVEVTTVVVEVEEEEGTTLFQKMDRLLPM